MKAKKSIGAIVRKTVLSSLPAAILTLVIIVVAIGTALLPPLVLERIINTLTGGIPLPLSLALVYFGLLAASGLLESAQNVMISSFGQRLTHGLRSQMCAKLKRLPAAYFTQHEPGEISSRFVGDVDVVDSLFTGGIINMFADCCKVLGILAVIFFKSTGLGLIMLVVTPLLFLMTRRFQRGMLKAQLQNRRALGKVNNHVPETIGNIRMIKTLSRQKYMADKYDEYMAESYRATDKSNLYDSIYSPIVVFVSSCVIAVMMVCSSLGTQAQQFFGISVGTAVAMIAYVGKIFGPLESIGMEIQSIQSAVAGIKRINEFLQEPERETAPSSRDSATDFPMSEDCIVFDHVDFGYGDDHSVLNDLSFTVQRGEALTFRGRTGAGKSTIFRLLLGLYSPSRGRVLINSVDADQIPDSEKRQLFGYVEQSFRPVPGTVAQQISLFDPGIKSAQIEDAARLVGLHESILALPQGYDTPMEKLCFSQGQLQLLSIARAVAASPKILLLDEITANLDSDTESRVLAALERAAQGRTVLSISHRLGESIGSRRSIEIGALPF